MGYVKHHAIVVTSWDSVLIEKAHAKAVEFCFSVTPLTNESVNGQRSFLIAPDGSKEGWETSDLGDAQREAFKRWAADQRHDDASTSLAWVEVSFSPDDQESAIVRDAWTAAPLPPSRG